MFGYYELDEEMIKKLPKESRNIKENVYDLCCPLVVKNKNNIPEEVLSLYEMLEIPIIYFEQVCTFHVERYIDFIRYLKEFSLYLKLNVKIEILEEGKIGHVLRVSNHVKKLCEQLNLSFKEKKKIYIAALFHDVGKYKIPTEIVSKNTRLSKEEYEIIKKHCQYSYDILQGFFPDDILNIIRAHHERCDKSGYPDGIIPNLGAKIIGIVDSFDAMVSNRVYIKRKSFEEALCELSLCGCSKEQGGKGVLYDSIIVRKFIQLQQKENVQIEVK